MKLFRYLVLAALVLSWPQPSLAQELKADQRLDRIAFGSCANQYEPQPIWKAVGAARPQLFLFIGDAMYADLVPTDKGYKLTRDVTKEHLRKAYDLQGKNPGYQ